MFYPSGSPAVRYDIEDDPDAGPEEEQPNGRSLGLLPASFRPSDAIVALRGFVRQRKMLVEYAAAHVQHIQKALVQITCNCRILSPTA